MNKIYNIIFIVALVGLCGLFGYFRSTNYAPQSTHAWRQADGAAFAENYYRYGQSFWKPRLFNRQEADGYMVGELPLTYYLAGQLYRVFGVHPFLLRGLHLLLFLGGLYGIFRMTRIVTGNVFWAMCVPMLFFAAPVLTFYGNNYLPDAPSFGLLMMGWALVLKYYQAGKVQSLGWAFVLFALAGLLKITMLISVIALGAMYVMEAAGWVQFRKDQRLFAHPWATLGGFAGLAAVVGGWYYFSAAYNHANGSDYFLNTIFSPWTWDNMEWFVYTFYRTFFFWSKLYFFPPMHAVFVVLTVYVLLARHYVGHFLYGLTLLTFLGFQVFFQLWYFQFRDHDYYIIPGYTYLVFLVMSTFAILKKYYPDVFKNVWLKVAIGAVVAANIGYAAYTMRQRYAGMYQYQPNVHLYAPEFREYLTNLDIQPHHLVVSIPDGSPNITLSLMGRPGFTEWIDRRGTPINADHVAGFIRRGAQYLIVTDAAYLEKEYVKPFTDLEIGDYKGIKIFDLAGYQ